MKFNCGHTKEVRVNALHNWHRWFAWWPVRVGIKECRWLEFVERKGKQKMHGYDMLWSWEYRA